MPGTENDMPTSILVYHCPECNKPGKLFRDTAPGEPQEFICSLCRHRFTDRDSSPRLVPFVNTLLEAAEHPVEGETYMPGSGTLWKTILDYYDLVRIVKEDGAWTRRVAELFVPDGPASRLLTETCDMLRKAGHEVEP